MEISPVPTLPQTRYAATIYYIIPIKNGFPEEPVYRVIFSPSVPQEQKTVELHFPKMMTHSERYEHYGVKMNHTTPETIRKVRKPYLTSHDESQVDNLALFVRCEAERLRKNHDTLQLTFSPDVPLQIQEQFFESYGPTIDWMR